MKISFLIRFKNEEKLIGECIEAILKQKGDFQKELIFINDNSTDRGVEIIKSFENSSDAKFEIIDLPPNSFTFSGAINYGISKATGDFMVIISAHATLIPDNWLELVLSNFDDQKVACTYGRVITRPDANTLSIMTSLPVSHPYKVIKSKEYFYKPDDDKNLFSYMNLNTCNCIRASIFKEKGYKFHELPSAEDMEFGMRLLNDGYTIIYEPRATVFHSHNDKIPKIVYRWITAIVAIKLMLGAKSLNQLGLYVGTLPSFTMFMIKVAFKEKKLAERLNYFLKLIKGVWLSFYEITFNFENYNKWVEKYLSSKSN